MLDRIAQFFTSLRLTLALLLGLALVAMAGTVKPLAEGRYDLFYHSAWYRLLLLLLALNLLACTIRTVRRNFADRGRLLRSLAESAPQGGTELSGVSCESAVQRLHAAGYHCVTGPDGYCAVRGVAGRWGSLVVHVSLLLIMLGTLGAELGFVGTAQLFVGDKTAIIHDWNTMAERPLGFELRLDRFEPLYYPIELQLAVVDPQTHQPRSTYTVKEGDELALPDGLQARVRKFFPFEEHLVLELTRDGQWLGEYHALGGGRSADKNPAIGMELRPLAFRDPVLKQLRSDVSILEGGQVVKQGVIEVNRPLEHRGIMIYQTAYTRDQFGFWAAGFQLSREPGKALVWVGSITLMLGLGMAFMVSYRALGVVATVTGCRMVVLAGFRGETGQAALRVLEADLRGEPEPTAGPRV